MRPTNFFTPLPALAAMALLAGCQSQEPDNPKSQRDNAIRFAAQTEYSRTGDFTTNNLNQFNVYAYIEGDTTSVPYMDNVKVTKSTNNLWTYTPTAYWPSSGSLNFYAYAPEDWVGADGPLKSVTWDNAIPGEMQGVTDLIYAVSPRMTGNSDTPNAQVIFNFRHALAKVTVRMSSSNPDLRVQVSNVVMAGIMSRGNFHFPKGNTADDPGTSNVGTWTGQNTPFPIFLHIAQTADDVINLTTTPTDMGDTGMGIGGDKFMIPQLLTWRSNGYGNDTYIAVMCSVYDASSGTKLWPNENTPEDNIVSGSRFNDGLLKFPLSTSSFSDWKAGYHYIYNLVINSNEEMGAIEFGTPTVDSFVEVTTNYQ